MDSLLARTQEAHAARRTAMNRSVTPPMAVLAMAVVRAMAKHGTCYACSTLTMALLHMAVLRTSHGCTQCLLWLDG